MNQHLSVQRKRASVETSMSASRTGDVAQALASPSPGRPLESTTRAWLESAYGHDFANVQVHADSEADQLASSLHAAAFTTGNDIYFREGAYDTDSAEGQHRLAHEAAHVVQQASGPVAGESGPDGVSVSNPADSFEQSADHAADSLMRGAAAPASVSSSSSSSSPAQSAGAASVQRSLWDDASDLLSGAAGGLAGLGQSAGSALGGTLGGLVGGPALAGLGSSAGGWLGGAAGGAIDTGIGAAEGVGSALAGGVGLGSALGTGLPGLIASGGGGLVNTIEDLF